MEIENTTKYIYKKNMSLNYRLQTFTLGADFTPVGSLFHLDAAQQLNTCLV